MTRLWGGEENKPRPPNISQGAKVTPENATNLFSSDLVLRKYLHVLIAGKRVAGYAAMCIHAQLEALKLSEEDRKTVMTAYGEIEGQQLAEGFDLHALGSVFTKTIIPLLRADSDRAIRTKNEEGISVSITKIIGYHGSKEAVMPFFAGVYATRKQQRLTILKLEEKETPEIKWIGACNNYSGVKDLFKTFDSNIVMVTAPIGLFLRENKEYQALRRSERNRLMRRLQQGLAKRRTTLWFWAGEEEPEPIPGVRFISMEEVEKAEREAKGEQGALIGNPNKETNGVGEAPATPEAGQSEGRSKNSGEDSGVEKGSSISSVEQPLSGGA